MATAADAGLLSAFGRRTFRETFADSNTPEDMAAYLDQAFSQSLQAAELIDADTVTLMANMGPHLVGYAQLRKSDPPPCVVGPEPIELVRFYVDREWHGRGAAHELMAATDAAASTRGRTLWLGVWEYNARAIAFYTKCGFVDVGRHEFQLGQDRQTDRIMARLTAPSPR